MCENDPKEKKKCCSPTKWNIYMIFAIITAEVIGVEGLTNKRICYTVNANLVDYDEAWFSCELISMMLDAHEQKSASPASTFRMVQAEEKEMDKEDIEYLDNLSTEHLRAAREFQKNRRGANRGKREIENVEETNEETTKRSDEQPLWITDLWLIHSNYSQHYAEYKPDEHNKTCLKISTEFELTTLNGTDCALKQPFVCERFQNTPCGDPNPEAYDPIKASDRNSTYYYREGTCLKSNRRNVTWDTAFEFCKSRNLTMMDLSSEPFKELHPQMDQNYEPKEEDRLVWMSPKVDGKCLTMIIKKSNSNLPFGIIETPCDSQTFFVCQGNLTATCVEEGFPIPNMALLLKQQNELDML